MTDDYEHDDNEQDDDLNCGYPPNSHPLERFGRTLLWVSLWAWAFWLMAVAQ